MTKDIDQETGRSDGKVCSKCGEWKLLDEYYRRKDGEKIRRHAECKECIKHRVKIYSELNKDKLEPKRKEWRDNNREHINERNKEWRRNNPDKARETQYKWNENNPDKYKATQNKRNKKRSLDPKSRASSSVSRAVRKSISSGSKLGRRTEEILGYTIEELRLHLEKLFKPGMTWENYGRNGWEIDHIIPIAAHNYETPDDPDFKKCWALSNLQPLWMSENRSKRHKLVAPFQPSLMLRVANDNQPENETALTG
jgi:hypothetical protein